MQKGFALVLLLFILVLLGGGVYLYLSGKDIQSVQKAVTATIEDAQNIGKKPIEGVYWNYDQAAKEWKPSQTPPECPALFRFPSPADLDLATGILYPGQVRGGDYKAHGGIRFDGKTNDIDVYAPFDSYLYRAARHLQDGEVQYVLYFTHSCGFGYKLDHLLELAPKYAKIIETIPMGAEGDSRTTEISPAVFVAENEHIATRVGLEKTNNVFFDFGLYDFRKRNGVQYSAAFRSSYQNVDEQIAHGVCFMDFLEDADKIKAYALPAGGVEGKTSDYCS